MQFRIYLQRTYMNAVKQLLHRFWSVSMHFTGILGSTRQEGINKVDEDDQLEAKSTEIYVGIRGKWRYNYLNGLLSDQQGPIVQAGDVHCTWEGVSKVSPTRRDYIIFGSGACACVTLKKKQLEKKPIRECAYDIITIFSSPSSQR